MIHLVRHGQTEANAMGLLQGRADLPLTDLGRQQADRLAAAVPAGAVIYSSPLLRARQTASLLAGGGEVRIEHRWSEVDYGTYDGLPLGEVPAGEWARWRSDVSFRPPGGESLVECGHRVRQACEALSDLARHQEVVVVSHVSPIKAAVAWALGVGDEVAWRMYLAVASVTRIAVTDQGPSLRSYNEVHHLS